MSAGIGCQRPGVYVWGLHIDGQPQALDLDYLESISSAGAFDGLLGLETLYLRDVDAAAR